MISRVHSFVLQGIDAIACEIEADLSPVGLPKTTVVGLPDAAVKESTERVRAALLNAGFRYPQARTTINLAPADVRKEGPVYDLPIAIALLAADGTIERAFGEGRPRIDDYLLAGELALDARVRSIRGAISLAMLARRLGVRGVIVPLENAAEAAAVDDVEVLGVSSLGQIVGYFNGQCDLQPHPTVDAERLLSQTPPEVDFGDVRGQEAAKRAVTIAAAGGHNLLKLCPSNGCGGGCGEGRVRPHPLLEHTSGRCV